METSTRERDRGRGPEMGRSPELSFPFSARNRGEPPNGGFASPASLPPQAFSTSRGLAPSAAFRVCFAPVTLMGLSLLRGFPPLVAEHLSARRAPLDVSSEEPAFRGLSAQRIRAHTQCPVKGSERPILSRASSSPGCSPRPRRPTLCTRPPPMRFPARQPEGLRAAALRGLCPRASWLASFESCRPP